ncbi:hypothetical protein [Nocardiopsis chromatogenes]|uniref:hypothetical protein n=1 Tax=Nocardiopsis chromatogenes TaxID=280239 RepID=UPI0003488D7F|nr:hypothetical protein [Nocardiopsis chromatogenes]
MPPRYLPGEILGALYRRKSPVITATAGSASMPPRGGLPARMTQVRSPATAPAPA